MQVSAPVWVDEGGEQPGNSRVGCNGFVRDVVVSASLELESAAHSESVGGGGSLGGWAVGVAPAAHAPDGPAPGMIQ